MLPDNSDLDSRNSCQYINGSINSNPHLYSFIPYTDKLQLSLPSSAFPFAQEENIKILHQKLTFLLATILFVYYGNGESQAFFTLLLPLARILSCRKMFVW